MEAATVERDRGKSRGRGRSHSQHSAYDNALIAAKKSSGTVDLVLAADFATPMDGLLSADDTIDAKVCHVDRYAVEFEIRGTKVWINKAFIAGVWIR